MGAAVDEREHPAVRRWPVILSVLAIGLGYAFVPDYLRIGPRWLLFVVCVLFLIPLNIVRRLGHYLATRRLALAFSVLLTGVLVASAVFFIARLPGGKIPATDLLRDGAFIWVANVLIFALWYWEFDCGGPHTRQVRGYQSRDFLFPQMAMGEDAPPGWKPEFVDYLFLAFNTSSAFSPTDTLVLSRPVKVLMMIQAIISITVFGVVIARAINTLT